MKIVKKVINIIGVIFVALVFVVSIAIIIMSAVSKKEERGYFNFFGNTFFVVQSDSMEPTLKVGDVIVCEILDAEDEINVEDIVSFKEWKPSAGWVINTHRVVEIENSAGTLKYWTQGDNVESYDAYAKNQDEFIARYRFRIGGLGSFINFLKEPLGFILCLVFPILVVIGVKIYSLIVLFLEEKKEQMVAEAKDATSDDIKDAIIREYLAKQAAAEKENKTQEDKKEDN